jgi:hypothetical protein
MKNNELEIRDHHKVLRTIMTLMDSNTEFRESILTYNRSVEVLLNDDTNVSLFNYLLIVLPDKYQVEKEILSRCMDISHSFPNLQWLKSWKLSDNMQRENIYYKRILKSIDNCKSEGQILDVLVKYNNYFLSLKHQPKISIFPKYAFDFYRSGLNFIYNPIRQFRNDYPDFDPNELMKADLKGLLVGSLIGIATLNPSIPIAAAIEQSLEKVLDIFF